MKSLQNDYQFLESTISLCSYCLKRVDAKIIKKENKIFLKKFCFDHGEQEEILEEDAEYYLSRMLYNKPGSISKTQITRKNNCPFDCGLCPEHEQHTCNGLIEITKNCNLKCPTCYANSGQAGDLSLEQINKMLDFFVDSEFGNAEILHISGGEPSLHPDIIEIIKLARRKSIKYILLNTNGLLIAQDKEFVKKLSQFVGGFEVYLQFDGFEDKIYEYFRGQKLSEIKLQAIKNLEEFNIPTTLVATIEKGINDREMGKIIEFGIRTKNIRGINFQPIAFFGRLKRINLDRITLSGIIAQIESQMNGMLKKKDFIALPCNVDRVAITYLYRDKENFIPLMRNIDIRDYLPAIRNTFKFDAEDFLKDLTKNIFFSAGDCCNYLSLLKNIKKVIPQSYFLKSEKEKVKYISANTFRISISSFVDAYNFDMRSIKKECVHVITPDFKKIPFSMYNQLYRK